MNKQALKDRLELNSGNFNEAIQTVLSFRPQYPTKPSKPVLQQKHTTEDVLKYADLLKQYEADMVFYRKLTDSYREEHAEFEEVIVEFMKDEAGLHAVPEIYRDKVYNKAWSDGHSDGYTSVYYHLC